MRVVLILTQELDHTALDELVSPGDEVHVIAPAVTQSRLQWLTNAEDQPRADAARLAEEMAAETATPIASAEERPDAPAQVVRDAIREYRPDRLVVVLRPETEAGWLESGELDRIPDEFEGVPIERHVLSKPEPSSQARSTAPAK